MANTHTSLCPSGRPCTAAKSAWSCDCSYSSMNRDVWRTKSASDSEVTVEVQGLACHIQLAKGLNQVGRQRARLLEVVDEGTQAPHLRPRGSIPVCLK